MLGIGWAGFWGYGVRLMLGIGDADGMVRVIGGGCATG